MPHLSIAAIAAIAASKTARARVSRAAVLASACVLAIGSAACACGSRGKSAPDGGDAAFAAVPADVARAEALATSPSSSPRPLPLPPRPEVIALAQSVEAMAEREGAGARAVELHVLAATLTERVWRVEHREQDAKEALDLYRAASRDLSVPKACEAGARGAELAGAASGDASTTYAELYRVWRRSGACARVTDAPLAALAPFRPPPAVLDAIDAGLAGEGAIAAAVADGGGANGSRVAVAPRVLRVEQWNGPEAARVVIHLDRPARFRVDDAASSAGHAAHTSVELDGVDLGGAAQRTPITGGIVGAIDLAPTTTGSRVSIELAGPAYRRVFHLLEPFRVVVDVAKQPPGAGGHGRERAVARVVLDPGHGGTDPGAVGPSGLKEKDVTLAIAHRVAPVLSRAGLEVTLTRDDDRFVTLEERTARANAFGADLFLSIHCNAAEKPGRHGVETYVLDTTSSETAGRVAARENAASQAASNEVAQLLASMRIADQSTRSQRLAELMQRSAVASLAAGFPDVTDGGVHKAGFYVLVGARMPAVLFETSYISNATEEQRLGSEDYQQRLADAIVNAVKAYREGR